MQQMNNDKSSTDRRVVLPDHIVPHRYDLKIIPDLVSFTFEGECRIGLTTKTIETIETINNHEIQLHAKELYFISAKIQVEGSSDPPIECEEVCILEENYDFSRSSIACSPSVFPKIISLSLICNTTLSVGLHYNFISFVSIRKRQLLPSSFQSLFH
jgi:hypothetical protein